jgi:hypothetical protein
MSLITPHAERRMQAPLRTLVLSGENWRGLPPLWLAVPAVDCGCTSGGGGCSCWSTESRTLPYDAIAQTPLKHRLFRGAGGGTRTHTLVGEADFKSAASTVPPRPQASGFLQQRVGSGKNGPAGPGNRREGVKNTLMMVEVCGREGPAWQSDERDQRRDAGLAMATIAVREGRGRVPTGRNVYREVVGRVSGHPRRGAIHRSDRINLTWPRERQASLNGLGVGLFHAV